MPIILSIPMAAHDRWLDHVRRWQGCQECDLCEQRDRIVLARGSVPCDVLLLGEAPGESENIHGLPFWGPAGDKLEEIMAVVRRTARVAFTEAYTNLVCCYPLEAKRTTDHRPDPEYVKACSPRLQEFVELAAPRLIVCVGDTADEWGAICCGAPQDMQWCKVVHPAAVLRMSLIQRESAARNCVNVIRNAVERAMGVI